MSANKTAFETVKEEAQESVQNLAAMIDYLDTHDIGDELEALPEVEFQINLPLRQPHFALEAVLAVKLREAAHRRGIPAEALLNQWVREKAESDLVKTV